MTELSPELGHLTDKILLGRELSEDELLLIRSSKGRLLKPGLTGDALTEAYQRFFERADATARKAEGVPDSEIDAAIDEAVEYVRHNRA